MGYVVGGDEHFSWSGKLSLFWNFAPCTISREFDYLVLGGNIYFFKKEQKQNNASFLNSLRNWLEHLFFPGHYWLQHMLKHTFAMNALFLRKTKQTKNLQSHDWDELPWTFPIRSFLPSFFLSSSLAQSHCLCQGHPKLTLNEFQAQCYSQPDFSSSPEYYSKGLW